MVQFRELSVRCSLCLYLSLSFGDLHVRRFLIHLLTTRPRRPHFRPTPLPISSVSPVSSSPPRRSPLARPNSTSNVKAVGRPRSSLFQGVWEMEGISSSRDAVKRKYHFRDLLIVVTVQQRQVSWVLIRSASSISRPIRFLFVLSIDYLHLHPTHLSPPSPPPPYHFASSRIPLLLLTPSACIILPPSFPFYITSARPSESPPGTSKDCPLDPYVILHDRSKFVDQQTIKLQEAPDMVPVGELPRHMQLNADRYLTGKVVPGSRVIATGIYSTYQSSKSVRPPSLHLLLSRQSCSAD
jgi:hypothetical protein